MNPKPAFVLHFYLDQESECAETTALIKRTWSYAAPTMIHYVERDHECVPPEGNEIRLCVKLHRPYWNASNEVDQANWESCIKTPLGNMIKKIAGTVRNANKVRDEVSSAHRAYSRLTVEFSSGLSFAVRLNEGMDVAEELVSMIDGARGMVAEGAFGDLPIVSIEFPSECSFVEQYNLALRAVEAERIAKAEEEAALKAQEAVEAEAANGQDAQADGADPQDAQEPEVPIESEDSPSGEEEEEKDFDFDIDYTVWGILYEDGSQREFSIE